MIELNTIYNEDCLETMKRMPDNFVDLIVTDPPYGISVGTKGSVGGGSKRGKAREFTKTDWDNLLITQEYFTEMFRVSKNQVIFGGNYYLDYLGSTRCMFIWFKRDGLPTRTFADCEIAWTSFDKNAVVYSSRWDGFIRDSKEDRVAHPTQKPLDVFQKVLVDFAEADHLIYDPFMGSGTTAEACKKLGFNYVGSEISKEYCDIAQQRLRQQVLL